MGKPRGIEWLEDQTGERIDYPQNDDPIRADQERNGPRDRHLSVRLHADLAAGLDAMASERGVTVSILVRELLADVVSHRRANLSLDAKALADRLVSDASELRRRLVG